MGGGFVFDDFPITDISQNAVGEVKTVPRFGGAILLSFAQQYKLVLYFELVTSLAAFSPVSNAFGTDRGLGNFVDCNLAKVLSIFLFNFQIEDQRLSISLTWTNIIQMGLVWSLDIFFHYFLSI